MKQKIQLILASFLLVSGCFLLYACDHDDWEADNNTLTDAAHGGLTNHHVVATGEVQNVTANSATILFSANYNYKESLKIMPYIIYSDQNKNKYGYEQLYEDSEYATVVKINNFTSSACEVTLTNLKPSTTYYYRAYATAQKPGYSYEVDNYGEIKSFTTPFDYSIYEAVDLGLSVKWANMNIGALHPEDSGSKFYWGGTEPSSSKYNADWHDFTPTTLLNRGYIDSNNNLTSTYDAASQIWGGRWRMPTKDEWQELLDKCTWTETKKNGVYCILITGPNSNVIFLPYYYYGDYYCYWSSTGGYSSSYYFYAYGAYNKYVDWSPSNRSNIYYIRPVQK